MLPVYTNLQKCLLISVDTAKTDDISQQTRTSFYSDVVKKNHQEEHDNVGNTTKNVRSTVNPATLNLCINKCINNALKIRSLGSKYSIFRAKALIPRMLIRNVNLSGLNTPNELIDNIISLISLYEQRYKNETDIFFLLS